MKGEKWKPVKGFGGAYEVSDLGRVRSIGRFVRYQDGRIQWHRGCFIKPAPNKKRRGYLYLGLSLHSKSKDFQLHRLVALHFVPNPNKKPQVNHRDGDKSNCSAENLEWVTAKENGDHAARTGLIGTRSISPELAKKIKVWVRKGESPRQAAEDFGVTVGVVDGILHRSCWNWL